MRARLPSPPPGITSAPRATSASNALQKPMNGPNENASSARSLGVTLGRVEHVLPAIDPPLPIVGRVEHDERPAARARRLMAADVAIDRIRAIGGERLVAGCRLQFFLRRLRQRGKLVETFELRGAAGQLAPVELVVGQHFGEQAIELLQLQLGERGAIKLGESPALVEWTSQASWHSVNKEVAVGRAVSMIAAAKTCLRRTRRLPPCLPSRPYVNYCGVGRFADAQQRRFGADDRAGRARRPASRGTVHRARCGPAP